MVDVFGTFKSYYKYIFEDLPDPRTNAFLLSSSHWIPIGICLGYLILVLKILPEFMKNREPYSLKKVVLVYNFTQIFFNGYLLITALPVLIRTPPACAPVDYSNSRTGWRQLELCYLYFILKIYDLFDTVVFTLRKRQRQVTLLHLYHHTMIILVSWIGLRYAGGGSTLHVGSLNTIVHIVMYFYYALSIWNSGKNNTLWWKKYLTQLQLVQFFLLAMLGLSLLLYPSCKFPKIIAFLALVQNFFLIYLFGSFYYSNYIASKKAEVKVEKDK